MINSDTFAVLPAKIQQLLVQRSTHAGAIADIDATLARVSTALGAGPLKPVAAKTPALKPSKAAAKTAPKAGKPGITASEFVLGFVKAKANPTSSDINTAWKASGRKWTADVILSQLTKAKKLTRTPLGAGIRGSRYAIPA